MKQVPATHAVLSKLQQAAGEGVDVSKHAVFEAIGLNTQPVRKEHPLYKGARHSKNYLQQMANAVSGESLPLQIMHDDSNLPIGRVFDGQVVDGPTGPELRVLFWVDPEQPKIISGLNSGTIDQVSVSTIAQKVQCSTCDYDFLGPDADLDCIFAGKCANGHQLGVDGNHVKMNDLGHWFEMSLVGRGGATGARIVSPTSAVLAATGKAAPFLTLSLSNSDLEPSMTPEQLAAAINTALGAALDAALKPINDRLAKLDAGEQTTEPQTREQLEARVVELEKKLADSASAGEAAVAKAEETGVAAMSALTEAAKHILTMSGEVDAQLPTDGKELVELVKTKLAAIKAPGAGGREAAAGSADAGAAKSKSVAAFKVAR